MRTYSGAAHFNKAQVFPVFPIDPSVANVFPLVPCVPPFSPCVSQLFLVFRVCNLWEATSCRANTTYTETVSIVYSVPSSQCGPNCVGCSLYILQFSFCSQCATYLCVPYCLLCSQFPVCAPCCTVLHFPILFSVCFECVPSVIHTIRCVPSVYIPCVFP